MGRCRNDRRRYGNCGLESATAGRAQGLHGLFHGALARPGGGGAADDLISRLAHSEATRDMDKVELLGALVLLLVAGSETTRSSISGSVLGLHQFPDQFELLKAEPGLIDDMISETMRWQSPAVHMRRIARRDVELGGKRIRRGDKVVMWYLSGNRDESVMERPNDFWIRRPNVRRHLSYGHGVHRCIGARLARAPDPGALARTSQPIFPHRSCWRATKICFLFHKKLP